MPIFAILIIAMAVLAIIVVAYYYSRDARIKRAISRAPVSTTREFEDGTMGKVHGMLRYMDEPLQAPLSGRPCAYYEVVVEELRSTGKSSTWRQIICERRGQDFLIEDQSGMARVNMGGAEVAVVKDAHFRSGTFNDATPMLEAFLARHGRSSKGWVFNKSIRYKEGVLEAGEQVAVCGHGMREPDPDPAARTAGYRDRAMRLVLSGNAQTPLYVSDDPSVLY